MSIISVRVTHEDPTPKVEKARSFRSCAIFKDASGNIYIRCDEGCVRITTSGGGASVLPFSEREMACHPNGLFDTCVEIPGRVNIHVELE